MQKKRFTKIYLRTVKLHNLTKNGILSKFDLNGRPFKSDIFGVTTVANSRNCTILQGNVNKRCKLVNLQSQYSEYIRLTGSNMKIKVA